VGDNRVVGAERNDQDREIVAREGRRARLVRHVGCCRDEGRKKIGLVDASPTTHARSVGVVDEQHGEVEVHQLAQRFRQARSQAAEVTGQGQVPAQALQRAAIVVAVLEEAAVEPGVPRLA